MGVVPIPYDMMHGHEGCPSDKPVAVIKTDDGELMGCHPDAEHAMAQIAALYAEEHGDEEMAVGGQRWRAPLAIIGDTSDGRGFYEITWRDPPLTLRAHPTFELHDGAEPIGRIDRIWMDGDTAWGEGVFDTTPLAIEAARLVAEKIVRGISVDAAVQQVEVGDDGVSRFSVEIIAATIVQMPAFGESMGVELIAAEPVAANTTNATATSVTITAGLVETWAPGLALVASGAASDIPAEWFADPGLTRRERLHVEKNGRIWGHVAGFGECHTGSVPGTCTEIPRDLGFDYFNLGGGVVTCANGTDIPTGPIVLSADHAKVRGISWLDARDHYAHSGLAVADVRAGMDAHGVWVAGALRPGTAPELVHAFKASRPSVDCRKIGGRWQLLALLSVNMPGFPALVAGVDHRSGQITALVASGAPMDSECGCGGTDTVTARLVALERLTEGLRADRAAAALALEADLALDRASLAARLEAELLDA